MEELNKIEDPYFYADRLTLPKYVVNAAGDQYFTPDSAKFYFDDLRGPKYLRYVPNADHSLRGSDTADSILAFYRAIVRGSPLPKFKRKMEKDGSITVSTETKLKVRLYQVGRGPVQEGRLAVLQAAVREENPDGLDGGEKPPRKGG